LKTEVGNADDDEDELEDDIEDLDDDSPSGEEGTLPEGALDISAQTDLVSSGGDSTGDVMVSPNLPNLFPVLPHAISRQLLLLQFLASRIPRSGAFICFPALHKFPWGF
jgi:hypothetical protein